MLLSQESVCRRCFVCNDCHFCNDTGSCPGDGKGRDGYVGEGQNATKLASSVSKMVVCKWCDIGYDPAQKLYCACCCSRCGGEKDVEGWCQNYCMDDDCESGYLFSNDVETKHDPLCGLEDQLCPTCKDEQEKSGHDVLFMHQWDLR